MANISIISACNNNCRYCFQQDAYHDANLTLSYEEILDIFDWIKTRKRIGILGGEPTLHPDIVKILIASNKLFEVAVLFTNLVCERKILEEIGCYAPRTRILINTTTRDEFVDIFEENMEYLNKIKKEGITIGITFTNELEYDFKNIDKMIRLGKQYPELITGYRISIATPHRNQMVELNSFEIPLMNFCKRAKAETPEIGIYFDCPINFCHVPFRITPALIEEYGVFRMQVSSACVPIVEIMADKSVRSCCSLPDGFLEIPHYRDFPSDLEVFDYFYQVRMRYMSENHYICKKIKDCKNEICAGPCMAMCAHLKKQIEGTYGDCIF